MCKENKELFLVLLCGVLFSCLLGALQAEEQEQWHLISLTELQSIEQYRARSEQEKQNWQSQARLLNIEANILHQDSISLNSQLSIAREQNRNLEQSFNEYEAASLTVISQKNGEIAVLEQENAKQTLRAVKAEGLNVQLTIVIIAMAVVIVLYIGFKVCRKFRLIP